jgi:dGTPase
MDWADDITYCVHDVEDFYRVGRIPLDRLRTNPSELAYFQKRAIAWHKKRDKPYLIAYDEVGEAMQNFLRFTVDLEGPYNGTRERRQRLYALSSSLINEFVRGTKLRAAPGQDGQALERSEAVQNQVQFLKDMLWCYVINNPALAGHQHGQREVVRTLFKVLDNACVKYEFFMLPAAFQDRGEELGRQHEGKIPAVPRVRLVADAISSMTDQQALRLYQRLTASAQGSVLDPIVQ